MLNLKKLWRKQSVTLRASLLGGLREQSQQRLRQKKFFRTSSSAMFKNLLSPGQLGQQTSLTQEILARKLVSHLLPQTLQREKRTEF